MTSGDAVKLSTMVLEWSGSKPEVALSLLRRCVVLLEEDLANCAADLEVSSLPMAPPGERHALPLGPDRRQEGRGCPLPCFRQLDCQKVSFGHSLWRSCLHCMTRGNER